MIRLLRLALVFLLACLSSSAFAKEPHILFLLGEKEYKTLSTVPEFYESQLKPLGFTAKFIAAPPGEPDRDDFAGLAEAIEEADLVFVSVRRRAPEEKDMKALKRYVAEGGPIVAIRTSSHAFHLRGKTAPDGRELWEKFDPEILGGNYHGHYGKELAEITVSPKAKGHPILKGVGELPSSDKLYQTGPLASSASAILTGTIDGKAPEPVAWTHLAGEKKARVFYTSLGQKSDFEDAEFGKLMINAIQWALQKD